MHSAFIDDTLVLVRDNTSPVRVDFIRFQADGRINSGSTTINLDGGAARISALSVCRLSCPSAKRVFLALQPSSSLLSLYLLPADGSSAPIALLRVRLRQLTFENDSDSVHIVDGPRLLCRVKTTEDDGEEERGGTLLIECPVGRDGCVEKEIGKDDAPWIQPQATVPPSFAPAADPPLSLNSLFIGQVDGHPVLIQQTRDRPQWSVATGEGVGGGQPGEVLRSFWTHWSQCHSSVGVNVIRVWVTGRTLGRQADSAMVLVLAVLVNSEEGGGTRAAAWFASDASQLLMFCVTSFAIVPIFPPADLGRLHRPQLTTVDIQFSRPALSPSCLSWSCCFTVKSSEGSTQLLAVDFSLTSTGLRRLLPFHSPAIAMEASTRAVDHHITTPSTRPRMDLLPSTPSATRIAVFVRRQVDGVGDVKGVWWRGRGAVGPFEGESGFLTALTEKDGGIHVVNIGQDGLRWHRVREESGDMGGLNDPTSRPSGDLPAGGLPESVIAAAEACVKTAQEEQERLKKVVKMQRDLIRSIERRHGVDSSSDPPPHYPFDEPSPLAYLERIAGQPLEGPQASIGPPDDAGDPLVPPLTVGATRWDVHGVGGIDVSVSVSLPAVQAEDDIDSEGETPPTLPAVNICLASGMQRTGAVDGVRTDSAVIARLWKGESATVCGRITFGHCGCEQLMNGASAIAQTSGVLSLDLLVVWMVPLSNRQMPLSDVRRVGGKMVDWATKAAKVRIDVPLIDLLRRPLQSSLPCRSLQPVGLRYFTHEYRLHLTSSAPTWPNLPNSTIAQMTHFLTWSLNFTLVSPYRSPSLRRQTLVRRPADDLPPSKLLFIPSPSSRLDLEIEVDLSAQPASSLPLTVRTNDPSPVHLLVSALSSFVNAAAPSTSRASSDGCDGIGDEQQGSEGMATVQPRCQIDVVNVGVIEAFRLSLERELVEYRRLEDLFAKQQRAPPPRGERSHTRGARLVGRRGAQASDVARRAMDCLTGVRSRAASLRVVRAETDRALSLLRGAFHKE